MSDEKLAHVLQIVLHALESLEDRLQNVESASDIDMGTVGVDLNEIRIAVNQLKAQCEL